jgi:hypothetical protein
MVFVLHFGIVCQVNALAVWATVVYDGACVRSVVRPVVRPGVPLFMVAEIGRAWKAPSPTNGISSGLWGRKHGKASAVEFTASGKRFHND